MPERDRGPNAYVIALAAALAAAVGHWLIFPLAGIRTPFVFFVIVTAYAAVFSGTGPALTVVLVGAINAALQFQPVGSIAVHNAEDRTALAIVTISNIVIAFGGGLVRRRTQRFRAAAELNRQARDKEAAERSRAELQSRQVLDQSPLPFSLLKPACDEQGKLKDFYWIYANPAAFSETGLEFGAQPGQLVSACVPHAWLAPDILANFALAVEKRKPHRFEVQVEQGETSRWFSVVASPVGDDVAIWFNDVSEEKLREDTRLEAERQKDEFIATLAHELRNPLAPIKQAAVLLENESVPGKTRAWAAGVIDRQVKVMSRLLEDLLDTSRISLGKLTLRKQDVELSEVIDTAVQTVQPLIAARQHELSVRILTPQKWLHVDPVRISQIVANLLTNAAKYTPNGGKIDLCAESGGGGLTISVCDNGIGIEPDKLEEIFDVYRQVHGDAIETHFGLGLGLTIVRGLTQLHGGSVRVTSKGRGHGAKFVVYLPRDALSPSHTPKPVNQHHHEHLSRRVLIVDDNRDAADTLSAVLSTMGHRVDVVYDGKAGVSKWIETKPDVAILDIGMPGMSGHEVAREIRASPAGERAKLIALTGWGQSSDRVRSRDSGFNAHFTKPVDITQLLEELQ